MDKEPFYDVYSKRDNVLAFVLLVYYPGSAFE
jgi:hypothetical protein